MSKQTIIQDSPILIAKIPLICTFVQLLALKSRVDFSQSTYIDRLKSTHTISCIEIHATRYEIMIS